MGFWDFQSMAEMVGGSWVVASPDPADPSGHPRGLSTDSREIAPGEAFLALRGERHDGHHHLGQAVRGGASLLIVDRAWRAEPGLARPDGAPVPVLVVHDTGTALLALAAGRRKSLDAVPVVAVTGSNGKTTTTRLVESVLSSLGPGTASIKSYNNRVGVPLTILRAKPNDRFLVCEVGTNAPGEIAELAPVVSPDVTVITSIGREHLEGLGGIEGSVHEAMELVRALRPGGTAVVPTGCEPLDQAVRDSGIGWGRGPVRVVRFGPDQSADVRVESAWGTAGVTEFSVSGSRRFRLPMAGSHNALNAAAALAVGRTLGLDDGAIAAAFERFRGPEMRMERVTVDQGEGSPPIEVLNDSYNANPESMLAALAAFMEMYSIWPGRRVAVLGDMLELGEQAEACHREIGEAASRPGLFDMVVLVGPLMGRAGEWFGSGGVRVERVAGLDDAMSRRVASLLKPGDAVLLKGSRGMRVERVLSGLRDLSRGRTRGPDTV